MLNFVPVNHTQYMSILTRTYPFKQSAHWLRDSAVYGVVIWAILYFLQPFGISLYTGNKCLFAAAFGVVTAVCYASYGCVVSKLLHPLVTPWRIWHQCCAVFGLVLFIALCKLGGCFIHGKCQFPDIRTQFCYIFNNVFCRFCGIAG